MALRTRVNRLAVPVYPDYVTWVGSGSGGSGTTWSGFFNWDGKPTSDIDAKVNFTSSGTLTIDTNASTKRLHGDGPGTVELGSGHSLSSTYQYVGYFGTGTFTQTGGTNSINNYLVVGRESGSNGTYTISNGVLTADTLYVSQEGSGTLNITGTGAGVEVSAKLAFGRNGTLNAVPGSTIHMTGSAVENESTDPDALAGLADLTLIFEGGLTAIDPFEVAGWNMGAVLERFEHNFALDTLQLGGDARVGQVQLVNFFDNHPSWEGSEALYVENLILGSGSYLDLNGLDVFYQNFADLGCAIDLNGGNLWLVPEPGTLAPLEMAVLCLLGYIRRRRKTRK